MPPTAMLPRIAVRGLTMFTYFLRLEKIYVHLLFQTRENMDRSIKFAYLVGTHGLLALIRLLCELPASHPLGTEP